jgi:chromatin segregation and condensation protein Rec8/ScpA/Scc1 (kleisin family)|tara:strand:- start:4041 stop:5036 length:996 start_codon:yes stop_codon:yes gene_type:complete
LIFGEQMRDDVVSRLLDGSPDLETSKFLDRLMELSTLQEAEHQFLIEPFDRSVALVFQMFQSSDLDPWDVDLSSFIEMFNQRIKTAADIDLPSCGRLIRMAWAILRSQSSTLIERQERALEFEEDDSWDFDGGWEAEFDDGDYNFSLGVMTGAADDVLPSIFEGRIHREEGRPVTLGELLLGLQDAGRIAEEQRIRERIAKERREANKKARARFSGSLHVEDLEGDLKRTWNALKSRASPDGSVQLADVAEDLNLSSLSQGANEDEARAEAQVTAFVSTLFLTNRGYIGLDQEKGNNGRIVLNDLWSSDSDYDELTHRLHPKSVIGAVQNV